LQGAIGAAAMGHPVALDGDVARSRSIDAERHPVVGQDFGGCEHVAQGGRRYGWGSSAGTGSTLVNHSETPFL